MGIVQYEVSTIPLRIRRSERGLKLWDLHIALDPENRARQY